MYLLLKMVIFQPAILVYWRESLFSTGVHIWSNKLPGRAIGGSVVQGALPLQLSSYLAEGGSSTKQTKPTRLPSWDEAWRRHLYV